MYPFMTQGLGSGGYNTTGTTAVQDMSNGAGFNVSTSANIGAGGFQGNAIGLLAILGGLVAFYMLTRSVQGTR